MMASAPQPRYRVDAIPAELRSLPRWVVFQIVRRLDDKIKKTPLIAGLPGRHLACVDVSSTWRTFELAHRDAEARGLYLGFAFGPDLPYFLVDADDVLQPDGTSCPELALIRDTLDTYTERSASGTGLHVIGRGSFPARCATPTLPEGRGTLELYPKTGGRFCIFTGDVLPGFEAIADRQGALDALFPSRPARTATDATNSDGYHGTSGVLSDDEIAAIIAWARPCWIDGRRHHMALYLSGYLGKQGVARKQALAIIDACARDDSDPGAKLAAAHATYDDLEAGEVVSGWQGLLACGLMEPDLAPLAAILDGFWRRCQPAVHDKGANDPADAGSLPASRIRARSMDQVTTKPVDWLWRRWLARGKVHLLAGLAGDGKSAMIAAIAAIGANVKAGARGTWPDDTPAVGLRTAFVLGEDGAEDTLKPRLELHGLTNDAARHVFTLDAVLDEHGKERFFNASKHAPELEAFVAEHAIDLLVIDPLSSAMPGSDRNGEGDVRDMLTPLVQLASARDVAILGIAHLRKGGAPGEAAQNKVLGSAAFTAVPRVVWQTATIDGRRYVGPTKSNLAVKPLALQWDREEDQPIVWLGAADKSMDALITGSTSPARGDKLEGAKGWLLELLEGGSKPAREVEKLALGAGSATKTLRNAREDLGIEAFKIPHIVNGPWYWRLPLTTEEWLQDQLRNGGKPEAVLLEHASERGVSDGDLVRAKARLDVRSVEVAPRVWHWVLPGKDGTEIEDAHSLIHPMGIFDSSMGRAEDAPFSVNGQVRGAEDRRIEDAHLENKGMGIFDSGSSLPPPVPCPIEPGDDRWTA